jgi:thymidylate kinase
MPKSNSFSISFSGVDGAGKTTVLKLLLEKLSLAGFKVVELRSRPSTLPILSSFIYGRAMAEKRATESLPRQGKNSSRVNSWLRYSYYLIDYIFGQFYVYLRYTRRGYIVVYDRFYFDYIVDPKRANLVLNKSIAKFFLYFIKQPVVNVFLYAPPEIILSRKRELGADEIKALTDNYLTLFEELNCRFGNTYLCIENIDLADTMTKIGCYLPKADL